MTQARNEPATKVGRAIAELLADYYERGTFGRGNAGRSKQLADNDIAAIEAEARDTALREQTRITAAAAVRLANHGKSQPPNDPCESCEQAVQNVLQLMADEVAALPHDSTPGEER